jgi:hypothetical protein
MTLTTANKLVTRDDLLNDPEISAILADILAGGIPGSGNTNITISRTTEAVTVISDSGTDGTILEASETDAGVMTADHVQRLVALEEAPGGSGSTNLAFTRTTTTLTVTSDTGSDATLPAATTVLAGLLSAADKVLLDGAAPKASPTFTGTVTGVTKAHVGLGNADNTADADKVFDSDQIGDATSTGKAILTAADATSVRTLVDVSQAVVGGRVVWTQEYTSAGAARCAGARTDVCVWWLGVGVGTTQPTNKIAGDIVDFIS